MEALFSKNEILQNKNCNVLCDQIFSYISEKFKDSENPILISGRLSANLQDDKTDALENIVFITADKLIFDFHQNNAKLISPTLMGVIKQKSRTLLYFDELYVEFWLSESELIEEFFNDLAIQKKSQIPNQTL
jgi:hypothetical protein